MRGEEASEKDICSYCGSQVPEGANFCPECGEPIKAVSEMAAVPIISGLPVARNY